MEEKVEAPVERRKTEDGGRSSVVGPSSIKLGERVTVRSLNAEGLVTALGESDAEVQIGTLRVRARLSDLVRKSEKQTVDDRPTDRGKSLIVCRPSSIVLPRYGSGPARVDG